MMLFDQFANPPEHWLKRQEDRIAAAEQHRIEYFTNLAEMEKSEKKLKKGKKSDNSEDSNDEVKAEATRRPITTTRRQIVTTRRTTTRRPYNQNHNRASNPRPNNPTFNSFGQLNRSRPIGAQKVTQKPAIQNRVKPTQRPLERPNQSTQQPIRKQPVRQAQPLQNIRTTQKPVTQVRYIWIFNIFILRCFFVQNQVQSNWFAKTLQIGFLIVLKSRFG